jgi:glyoxylase-like metal-dependent hydrolase (beta-lactamase superfamily II)/rhodanese-related sulfurtransferase
MVEQIDVFMLQSWLAEKQPVTVLDIRTAADREQWWIPGSVHVDAYESLKCGDPGPLKDLSLPPDQLVVTVCGFGRMSLRAAEFLDSRGLRAGSLRGGMQAWSLAWNSASRSLDPVEITQVRRTGKGCFSYLVICDGQAAVIDASVEPEAYMSLARHRSVRIRYVLDTHIHADHLSRARILATLAGAELIFPQQDRVAFPHRSVIDGDRVRLGRTSIEVISTPGHTWESASYVIPDAAVFSGDTLFLAGVGRPDLHADEQEGGVRARLLFRSLRRLTSLDPRLALFPGHTSEPVPFDGDLLTCTLGEVTTRLGNWLASEDQFVDRLLARIPPAPPNYAEISRLNERGEWPERDPTELEAGANRCAVF